MSDPFSVAAGAVGIISLGIQLCKEISSYTEAWQGYDGDIQSISLKAKSLRTPLKRLRDLVEDTRLTDPEIANDINEKAMGLDSQVKRLEKKLKLIKPVFSDKPTEKFRNKLKKVAYPVVMRDCLRDIRSDLDSMQSTIQMSLAIFNAQQAQKSQATQEKMVQLIEEMHLTTLSVSSRAIPAPGVLRSMCDRCDKNTLLVHHHSQEASVSQNDIFDIHASQTRSILIHRNFHRNKRNYLTKSVERSYQYHSHWLRRTIKFSFSLSTGAGGLSIAPVLHMNTVLDRNSWAYNKLWDLTTVDGLYIPFFDGDMDNLIHDFQIAFSTGKATPSDMLEDRGDSFSLVDSFHLYFGTPVDITQKYKFARFLVDCGSVPHNRQRGFLSRMCALQDWGPDEYAFAGQLINLGGPLSVIPYTAAGKRNMKGLLERDDELIDIPEIAKIILQESEVDLRKALECGSARPNDSVQGICLLALAVGWPAGVRILLELGADATQFALGHSPSKSFHIDDTDCDNYYYSAVPLLQAGCILDCYDVLACRSQKVRSLLSHELAKRRRRLQALAQSCLPPQRLAAFSVNGSGESEEQILDVHAFQTYNELLKQGLKIDTSLQVRQQDSRSIYHQRVEHVEAWQELYKLGFRSIDAPDANGLTPLMHQLTYFAGDSIASNSGVVCIIWLFEKGASLTKTLPHSNGTVAHFASSWVIGVILNVIWMDKNDNHSRLPRFEAKITAHRDALFLVPSVRDHCACVCCPGGCTTFSVALRSSVRRLNFAFFSLRKSAELFRQVFNFLVQWTEARPATAHTIIRSLTFNALGLRHTCCTEAEDVLPFEHRDFKGQQEVSNIQEEDHHRYYELERLVGEFVEDFDQFGLPIMEFLDNHWHGRMVDYLSKPGSYDEQHIQETRNLGIFLEPHKIDIPDVVYYFGSPVEEVTSVNDS